MHKEILSQEQTELLPVVFKFSHDFGLVGGTAIALHLGHRRSIDFDLCTQAELGIESVQQQLNAAAKIEKVLVKNEQELTVLAKSVKFTFFHYPFPLEFSVMFEEGIKLPDVLTLAAMKAYALGRRSKWKDYVDLFFILEDHHALTEITERAREIFGGEFNARIFRQQLCYFDDINYDEAVEFMPGFETEDDVIKQALEKHCVS